MLKSDHPSSMREELAEHTRNLAEDVQVPTYFNSILQFLYPIYNNFYVINLTSNILGDLCSTTFS
jgi:hypothetical protein